MGHEPASLGFEQASGLLLVGGTAWHLLTKTRVGTGDTVLIHGASGGVGLKAVQLAVARGDGLDLVGIDEAIDTAAGKLDVTGDRTFPSRRRPTRTAICGPAMPAEKSYWSPSVPFHE